MVLGLGLRAIADTTLYEPEDRSINDIDSMYTLF